MPFTKGHPAYSTKGRFQKGHTPHNKGIRGYVNGGTFKNGHAPAVDQWDDKNSQWKGDEVGYISLHTWVAKRLGKPSTCEHCGDTTKSRYEWANKSHEYKRELSDWIRLCCKCHQQYDGRYLNNL